MALKQLLPEDLMSITDVDLAFGTTKFLPAYKDLPNEFQDQRATGCNVAECIFYGRKLPDTPVKFRPGFEGVPLEVIHKFVVAHLKSFEPQHEHKIAGVGWLIEQITEFNPEEVRQ